MLRLHGYDAEVELTALPGAVDTADGLRQGQPYSLRFAGRDSAVVASFATMPPYGSVGLRLLRLDPPGNPVAQLSAGLLFEVRAKDVLVAHGRVVRCWFGCTPGHGIRTLNLAAFRAEAVPPMLRVFRSILPTPAEYRFTDFERPFQPTVAQRGIIDCCGPFPLEHFRALVRAAHLIGDSGLFLYTSELGLSAETLEQYPPCFFPLTTAAEVEACVAYYRANAPPLEANAAFSATGLWGAWTTDGYGATVGGPSAFMEWVYAKLGTTEEQEVQGFFEGYEGHLWLTDHLAGRSPRWCEWVPGLLAHLYGEEKAARYIAAAEQRAQT